MPRIYPLFSSSKGNSTFIVTGSEGILIDCGVSFTRLKKALELNDLSLDMIRCVFITHSHSDHVSGLSMLTRKTGIPVASQAVTLDLLYDSKCINSSSMDINETISVGDMTISCFDTSHDTEQSCGYKIVFPDGKSCSVCTDLGYISDIVRNAVIGCDAVLLESNYDEEMLRNGPYPVQIKQRIRSAHGHLSNTDCAEFASELIGSGTTRLILGHISQENNRPDIAEYTVESTIARKGYQRGSDYLLYCAPVETTGGFVTF